jgi:hypothetical protein
VKEWSSDNASLSGKEIGSLQELASILWLNWLRNCLWAQENSTVNQNGSKRCDLIPKEAINYVLLTIRKLFDCSLAHGFVWTDGNIRFSIWNEFLTLLQLSISNLMHEFHTQTLPQLCSFKLRNLNMHNFNIFKNKAITFFKSAPHYSLREFKHNEMNVREDYCWAITQALGRSWFSGLNSIVLEGGFQMYSHKCIWLTIECVY